MYAKLRSLHLLTALFSLALLLMYAASGVQMAHRRWFPLRETVTRQSVALSPGLAGARAVAREIPLAGEITSVFVTPYTLRYRIERLGTVCDVTYSVPTGAAEIRTTASGFAGTLNRIHRTRGLWHEYKPWNAWAAVLGLVSLGLLTMGASGLYLWFRNHAERWIGCVLLAGGGMVCALIVSMRMG